MPPRERRLRRGGWRGTLPWVVAAAFTGSGLIHLVRPATFTPIVPRFLPAPRALVYLSGVAELACAAGLWRRERWAGLASAVLLVLVWPANIGQALTAQHGRDTTLQLLTWARVPLQVPLVWFALQSGREPAVRAAPSDAGGPAAPRHGP